MSESNEVSQGAKILLAIAVAVLLYVLFSDSVSAWYNSTTPVAGSVGGVTNSGNAQAAQNAPTPPASSSSQPATVAVEVAAAVALPVANPATGVVKRPIVKSIEITKISALSSGVPPGENDDWKTFQIGEVRVYNDAGALLPANAFISATYNTVGGWSDVFPAQNAIDNNPGTFTHTSGMGATHQLRLVLAAPTAISRVEVVNRQDCCQSRLQGALLTLRDAAGVEVGRMQLTQDMNQTGVFNA